jgi:predicted RNA-binding Zn-ribbon protein involved in translation (DUF1610 family)
MHASGAHWAPAGRVRPALEVADIVRRFGDELVSSRALGFEQRQALEHIALCRTARLGGHVDVCPECGLQRPAYNSCRDRHCPKCQWLLSERWLDSRLERMLPVHHFHVVFTLPSELRLLTMYNRRALFQLLFESGTTALKKLGADDRRLGALLGITAVLHTWSRDLGFHPHIHCVVTGGGLASNGNWVRTRPGFLFPVRVLGKLFRGIFLDRLIRLAARGQLRFDGKCDRLASPSRWRRFIDSLYRKQWNVYSKKPFGGIEGVHRYLAKYTHRIAISNRRLISFDDRAVTFYTRDTKTASLPPLVFLARFLTHVLPRNFVRIRHFGLYASANVNTRLQHARVLLEHRNASGSPPDTTVNLETDSHDEPDWVTRYRNATGIDLRLCPNCGAPLYRFALVPERAPLAIALSRAPPVAA